MSETEDKGDSMAQILFPMIRQVDEFFQTSFGRQGYQDLERPIEMFIHAFKSSGIARFYHTTKRDYIVFGDGDKKNFYSPVAALDIVAHEMMHGYFTYLCPVKYGFSDGGAILEHLCDIFGVKVRRHEEGGDWKVGNGYTRKTPAIRDLENPKNPSMLLRANEHIDQKSRYRSQQSLYENAGILSKSFVLAENGYSGVEDEAILKIWYKALQNIPRNCDFNQFAHTVRAFADLSGSETAQAVDNAFKEVGL